MKIIKNVLFLVLLIMLWMFVIPPCVLFKFNLKSLIITPLHVISPVIFIVLLVNIGVGISELIGSLFKRKDKKPIGQSAPQEQEYYELEIDEISKSWQKEAEEDRSRFKTLIGELSSLETGHYRVHERLFVKQEIIDCLPTSNWILLGLDGVPVKFTKAYLDAHPEMFKWVE